MALADSPGFADFRANLNLPLQHGRPGSCDQLVGLGGALATVAHADRDLYRWPLAVTAYSLLQKKDYSGTGNYQNERTSDKGDNNRFRLVWWKNVAEETLTTAPVLGQGFGADLTYGFLREYYATSNEDFTARSPHNIFITTLGRMGLAGFAILLGIYFVQARSTARVARAARHDPARAEAMTLQAAVWVVMISACLGVVLEGPMGAIPFWIMLGLAHHAATAPLPADSESV